MSTPEEQERSRREDPIQQAVGRAAQRLLQATAAGTDSAVHWSLAEVGEAARAGRVDVYENVIGSDGALLATRAYHWHAEGVSSADPLPAELAYAARDWQRWRERLSQDEAIHGACAELALPDRRRFERAGILAVAVIPLFVAGQWWGFVGFYRYEAPHPWVRSELDALDKAVRVLGAAFRRRQAEHRLRQRNRELGLLNRVVAAATSSLEPVRFLEIVCRELAHAFDVPQARATLLNPEKTALQIVACYSELEVPSPLGREIRLAESEFARALLETEQPLVIPDVGEDARLASVRELMEQQQIASMLIMPLVVDGEAVGTLGLDSPAPRTFPADEVDQAMNVVAAATQALSKARLLATEQRNAARISGILRLSTELATIRDEEALLQHLVSGLAEVADSVTCTVFFAEGEETDPTREAVLVAQVGLPDGSVGMRIPLTHPALEDVLNRHEPLLVADIDRQLPVLRNFLVRDDIHAFYVYPLSSEGRALGFITLSYHHTHDPTQNEVNAYRLLAERAAAALHTVRLLGAVRQQAEQLGALRRLGLAISSSFEPEKVYQAVVEQTANLIGVEVVSLFLVEPDGKQFVGLVTYGGGAESVRGERHPVHSDELVPELVKRTTPLPIEDAAASPLVSAEWRTRFNAGAILGVPLRYRETLIGFIVCAHPGTPRRWTAEEIALAESLAAQAAIAVANARLHAATRGLLAKTRAQARTVRQIVDTIPEGLLLLDDRRRVLMANPLAREYLPLLADYGPGDVLRTLGSYPLDALLAPPPAGRLTHELVVNRPRRRIFELSAHNLASGPQAGNWILVIHESTAEREQQAYLHAQDRLATVGQLAAGIAHDFNNIMAVISLYSQTLLQQDYPEPDRERLSVIYEQAGQASRLIGQILDFSRRSVVERRPLNLVPFLKELVKLLDRTLPETIAIELSLNTGEYLVRADPTRLQQAVMNLALNARDAMVEGGVLQISLVRHGPDWQPSLPDMVAGHWICLTVADSGRGIPHEHRAHIFEPFYTTKESGEGAGLGLAQVYGIVKQHDGFINLSSEPGVGTIVSIYLPALTLPHPEPAQRTQAEPEPAGGETLLLVEDDAAMRAALAHTLEDLNYRVLVAAHGEEALAVYHGEAGQIDLVLSDLVMPRMGGQALYRALRDRYPHVRMVLFSGYPLGESTRKFVEESGLHWLQKPFTSQTVHDVIQEVLA